MLSSEGAYRGIFFLLILTGLFIIGPASHTTAQQLRSQVKLMLERLPLEKQEKLKNFADDIEVFINDYDWTGEASDDEIPISIQIFLMDASVSFEPRYTGTFLITNNLDIQYYDKYWKFAYEAGTRLDHNENIFDSFTGFIEVYIYLILGGEYDKYGKFMGAPYFERAKLISDQAKFSSRFMTGLEERTKLIDKIMSDEYKPFREMKDLFFLGMSYVGEQDTTAQRYCSQSLDILEDVLKGFTAREKAEQFMKAHHIEYIDVFKDDQDMLQKMIRIDPDREETYRQYVK